MNKLWSLLGLGLALTTQTHAQTPETIARCDAGLANNSVLCVDVTIRDFNIWLPNRHSDFENFTVTGADPVNGCGNTVLTNRDYLLGVAASKDDQVKADWAAGLLNSPVADDTLKYGEVRLNNVPTRGFMIDVRDRQGGSFTWDQPVIITTGMVKSTLDANGKPVKAAQRCDNTNFDQWFNTVPGVNYEINDLMVLDTVGGSANSQTYRIKSNAYFPLDAYHGSTWEGQATNFGKQAYQVWCGDGKEDKNKEECDQMDDGIGENGVGFNVNDPRAHNYGYTMEGEIKFAHHGGEVFTFSGDDDMWIFIDGEMVADIGGTHLPGPKTIYMDELAAKRGWELHKDHTLKFFYADRQTDGSNLVITTTLNDVVATNKVAPIITKSFTESGKFGSFLIFSNTPLSEATLAAISNGGVPDFIHSSTGTNPVVTGISAVEATDETARYGQAYEVFVSSGRPNEGDSISFNPFNLSGTQITGVNGKVTTNLGLRVVDFLYSVQPKPPADVDFEATPSPIPTNPTAPEVLNAIYGNDDGQIGDLSGSIGSEIPINRGAEITLVPNPTLNGEQSIITAEAKPNAAGVFSATHWGMLGNPSAPGRLTAPNSASADTKPIVNCKIDDLGNHSCFDFTFVVTGSFRLNMYVYDHNGQYIRQFTQFVSKGMLDTLRLQPVLAASPSSVDYSNPIFFDPSVAVNVGLYPLASDGRLLGDGVYIITYDLLEYPETSQIYEGGTVTGSVQKDTSQPNRTIETVRAPYRRTKQ